VFDENGASEEYTIVCALEFVNWLNRDRMNPIVHGVNLSLALAHDVDSFACGQTPICEVCNFLVGAGTVVVAAAGNTGFENGAGPQAKSMGSGYRAISITDPGNADYVITVGSTHRRDPHLYGVSYFSARGPTGDGRRKPDILAPGEKITSTIPGGQLQRMDGTSMAAPHVSGAAAMLMGRYPELIGRPLRIKQVLMDSATDLKREPNFQGAGLVDVLRALQSV
jgi:serine protease AprX